MWDIKTKLVNIKGSIFNMEYNKLIPNTNVSESVLFLLRGAKKRRSMAVAKAKMIQGQLGVIPRLAAVK